MTHLTKISREVASFIFYFIEKKLSSKKLLTSQTLNRHIKFQGPALNRTSVIAGN
jgi:hypothetical protein